MELTGPIRHVMDRPPGAVFRRCALQVNPYPYLVRSGRDADFSNADHYNSVLLQALLDEDIRVIGITDHDRVDDAGLRKAAEDAGLVAFPGVEVCSSDGVHVLVLFDAGTGRDEIEHFLGWCQVDRSSDAVCRPCRQPLLTLLEGVRPRRAVTVLPHVVAGKGLFTELRGQPLVNVWECPDLLAIAIPGDVPDLGLRERRIVQDQDANYSRDFPVAVLNANDISSPADIHPRSWSWIKTASETLEGLRQAFLDPASRVRLSSDPVPEEHSELVGIAWQGGFLDDCVLRFNENLNVLIGGRGAGKSTVIESLRYALGAEPLGKEAQDVHRGIVEHVLGDGTTIELLVRSSRPDERHYVVRRTVGQPPVVLDTSGNELPLSPRDVLVGTEVYGQHEIAELARQPERRTTLLDRFVEQDPTTTSGMAGVMRRLQRNRERIINLLRDEDDLKQDLAKLPALQEQLHRFEEAGVEDSLRLVAGFAQEDSLLERADRTVTRLAEAVEELGVKARLDRSFLEAEAVGSLPSQDILEDVDRIPAGLESALESDVGQVKARVTSAREVLTGARRTWSERRDAADTAHTGVLKALDEDSVEDRLFIRLRKAIADLSPLQEKLEEVRHDLTQAQADRAELLEELEALRAHRDDAYARAAKRVSRQLADFVRVSFRPDSDRESIVAFLRESVGGRLDSVASAIESRETFSAPDLAGACRAGEAELKAYLPDATDHQRGRVLHELTEEAMMALEELSPGPALDIELNVAGMSPPRWRMVERLSTGQKATAILLLLLVESAEPLVVDQPEDDLDNEFISEGIVPRIRQAKRTRQFVFSSHNANLPVLGDAELIAVVRACGEPGVGQGDVLAEETGAIDSDRIRELVEQLLEGGHAAFETRRRKYRF